jgi:hypothetical protein
MHEVSFNVSAVLVALRTLNRGVKYSVNGKKSASASNKEYTLRKYYARQIVSADNRTNFGSIPLFQPEERDRFKRQYYLGSGA